MTPMISAAGEHARDNFHEANTSAAINQADAASGQLSTQVPRRLRVIRKRAAVRPAINTDVLFSGHGTANMLL